MKNELSFLRVPRPGCPSFVVDYDFGKPLFDLQFLPGEKVEGLDVQGSFGPKLSKLPALCPPHGSHLAHSCALVDGRVWASCLRVGPSSAWEFGCRWTRASSDSPAHARGRKAGGVSLLQIAVLRARDDFRVWCHHLAVK